MTEGRSASIIIISVISARSVVIDFFL